MLRYTVTLANGDHWTVLAIDPWQARERAITKAVACGHTRNWVTNCTVGRESGS